MHWWKSAGGNFIEKLLKDRDMKMNNKDVFAENEALKEVRDELLKEIKQIRAQLREVLEILEENKKEIHRELRHDQKKIIEELKSEQKEVLDKCNRILSRL